VSSRVAADSHPVRAPRTPKRLNGVTHAARSLARSYARGTACKLIDPATLRFAFSNDSACRRSAPRPVTTSRVDRIDVVTRHVDLQADLRINSRKIGAKRGKNARRIPKSRGCSRAIARLRSERLTWMGISSARRFGRKNPEVGEFPQGGTRALRARS